MTMTGATDPRRPSPAMRLGALAALTLLLAVLVAWPEGTRLPRQAAAPARPFLIDRPFVHHYR